MPDEVLQQFPSWERGVIKLEKLNLAVKFGHSSVLKLEEAQVMIAIRRAFPNGEVPVPEVFGWRRRGDFVFIYMGLIPGVTLGVAWPSLTEMEKESISNQLAGIIAALRRVVAAQGAPCSFIGTQPCSNKMMPKILMISLLSLGSINGGRIQDRYFQFDDEAGPLPTVKLFNDLLLAAATRQEFDRKRSITGPYRELLPDTGAIRFTHGDLTLGNIMVSGAPGSQKITSIIDWEQAGWYPEYWEYCKMLYAVHYEHEWRTAGWVDRAISSYEDEWWAVHEYFIWRGCP